MRGLVARLRIPGMSITVSRGRAVVWHEGFGFADTEAGIPATPDTRYRIGSVSKLITATALLRLAQDGNIELDAGIGQYIELPAHLQTLTLRQLAGHTAGIRHYRGAEFFSTEHYANLSDALTIFASDTLLFAPGTRYSYSSYGYNLIGAALERALQRPFEDIVRRNVLDPLLMRSTMPDAKGMRIPLRARGYSVGDSATTAAPDDDLSGRWPSGGYLSSTDDMVRLGQITFAAGFLSEQSLQAISTPQTLASGEATAVGIGWRVSTDSTGRRYLHHGGSSNGGSAFLLVVPGQQLVVAIASNAYTQWGEQEAIAIARIFGGPLPGVSRRHAPSR